jgi:hypothetical protein
VAAIYKSSMQRDNAEDNRNMVILHRDTFVVPRIRAWFRTSIGRCRTSSTCGIRPSTACCSDTLAAGAGHRRRGLSRLPLRSGRRLLRRSLFGRLLAGDRHQHFLLTACGLRGFLAGLEFFAACVPPMLLRIASMGRPRFHREAFLGGDRLSGALLVDQIGERGFVLIFELARLEVTRFLSSRRGMSATFVSLDACDCRDWFAPAPNAG